MPCKQPHRLVLGAVPGGESNMEVSPLTALNGSRGEGLLTWYIEALAKLSTSPPPPGMLLLSGKK